MLTLCWGSGPELQVPASGRPVQQSIHDTNLHGMSPPAAPLFLPYAFLIMWYFQCSVDLQEMYWQPCEFCIYLSIYLVDGGAVICGPLASGQRKTCWLLGYWETPPALISEEERDEEEDRRWKKEGKKERHEWKIKAGSEETRQRRRRRRSRETAG